MDKTTKLLLKIPKKDLERIREATRMLQAGEISGIKLKNKNEYRYRVGEYRIIYQTKNGKNLIVEVRKRNENSYK